MATLIDASTSFGAYTGSLAQAKKTYPWLALLGIQVDTAAGELRLLVDKLQCLQMLLQNWGDKVCSCHELE